MLTSVQVRTSNNYSEKLLKSTKNIYICRLLFSFILYNISQQQLFHTATLILEY